MIFAVFDVVRNPALYRMYQQQPDRLTMLAKFTSSQRSSSKTTGYQKIDFGV